MTLFCTFRLNGLFLGIDVQQVQEVLRYQEMTSVPLAPPVIAGLLNLRGEIVTAIDLRQRLDMEPLDPSHDSPMNVVVRLDCCTASLVVDSIGDVIEVDPALFEPPPPTLQDDFSDLLVGVYKLPEQLLLILDVHKIVNFDVPSRAK